MNRNDLTFFPQIRNIAKLLSVNWNALESNPPCKRNIDDLIIKLNTLLTEWDNVKSKDLLRYEKVRTYKYKLKD